ncbi:unnamed protein product [Protopolystoma xenopodis]|uniref:Uncharacterized protein n=1 Tax=Protopolystoma xenopodis TaxID=117903 RepID=A0A448X144_9PLAT|nr:unnamed protein product [Protopolystoma xenopodis]
MASSPFSPARPIPVYTREMFPITLSLTSAHRNPRIFLSRPLDRINLLSFEDLRKELAAYPNCGRVTELGISKEVSERKYKYDFRIYFVESSNSSMYLFKILIELEFSSRRSNRFPFFP